MLAAVGVEDVVPVRRELIEERSAFGDAEAGADGKGADELFVLACPEGDDCVGLVGVECGVCLDEVDRVEVAYLGIGQVVADLGVLSRSFSVGGSEWFGVVREPPGTSGSVGRPL